MAEESEQGATGRRLAVSITLLLLGVGLLAYGLFASNWPAVGVGTILTLIFGLTAAGMKRGKATAGPIKVETDFTAPPPPRPGGPQSHDEPEDGSRPGP
jgi:hypothetical protein